MMTQEYHVPQIDVKNYAKFVLQNGTRDEKRDLLACLKSKIFLKKQKIYIDKKRAKEVEQRGDGNRTDLNIGKIAEIGKTKSRNESSVILCLFGSNKFFSTNALGHLGHFAQKKLARHCEGRQNYYTEAGGVYLYTGFSLKYQIV